MGQTTIAWTDYTFNPWWGCQKASEGCAHCYAETMAHRFHKDSRLWGPPATSRRREMSENTWAQPVMWNAAAARKGKQWRVFCASMADVFEDAPGLDSQRGRLFHVIRETPNLTWLLLTKRPQNIRNGYLFRLLPNVWLGTSTENQATANTRVPMLLEMAEHSRTFISAEPLLGPVDLSPWLSPTNGARIGWVIVGGESGPSARPMEAEWAEALSEQCASAKVPYFFKQFGDVLDKQGPPLRVIYAPVMRRESPV